MGRIVMVNGAAKCRIDQLRVGDRVDLEGDQYADPGHDRPDFQCEFQVVSEIEHETAYCVVVHFDNFSCGFPPDHMVDVDGEQTEWPCAACGNGEAACEIGGTVLCDDCLADKCRTALQADFGRLCCSVSKQDNGYLRICLAPSGVEHEHNM